MKKSIIIVTLIIVLIGYHFGINAVDTMGKINSHKNNVYSQLDK